jgi:TolB-like protein/DNA-binding winged helix-turn-helix (wHTH) protein/Flp pilus assembly protein TadD
MDVLLREAGIYRFGPFRLDPARRALFSGGERIKLAERLFDALLYLVVNHGRLVERDELLQAVWAGRAVEENNLGQAIFALRKALRAAGGADSYIITVPSRGFRFAEPVLFEAVQAAPWSPAIDAQPDLLGPPPAGLLAPAIFTWRGRLSLAIASLALFVATTSLVLWQTRAPSAPDRAPAEQAFAPPAHSIAVLAFDNMSGDPKQAYFSDGLAEQLIDSLTRINGLQVAGRISSFSFRGSHATIGDIARKLNVSAVLQGSVRRAGARVVVTAQLTNAVTGFNFWSRTYDRNEGDIVNVQTDIAQAVTQSLQVSLIGGDVTQLTVGSTTSAAAYDAYLHGISQMRTIKDEDRYRAALADFDRALALDPNYARAHAARASALMNIVAVGAMTNAAAEHRMIEDAMAAADRAIALAPDLAGGHSARATVLNRGLLDHQGAEQEELRALALGPGAVEESNYASVEVSLGHLDQAVAAAKRGAQLDPLSAHSWNQLGRTLFMAHRFDEARDALGHLSALTGALPLSSVGLLGGILVAQGHPEDARKLCAAATSSTENVVLAMAEQQLGHQAEAAAHLARVRALQGDAGAVSYAEIYAQWHRTDDALQWLETAVRLHDPDLSDIDVDPMLDPIRSTPRFKDIVARLKAEKRI